VRRSCGARHRGRPNISLEQSQMSSGNWSREDGQPGARHSMALT
jgi:hypothetical protein